MATRNLTPLFNRARELKREKPEERSETAVEIKTDYLSHFENIDSMCEKINREIINAQGIYDKFVRDVFAKNDYKHDLEDKMSEIGRYFDDIRKIFLRTESICATATIPHRKIITNMHRQKLAKFQTLVKKFQSVKSNYIGHLKMENNSSKRATEYFGSSLDEYISEMRKNQSQVQIDDEYEVEHKIMEERNKEIAKLCESMEDLNRIFQDLSVMIVDQGQIIDRIDKTIDETLVATTKGTEELKKAEQTQKKCIIM